MKKFKKKIAKIVVLQKLILFGSRARGTFLKESDFDLIIVSDSFNKMPNYKRASPFHISWDLDYDVDFLCYTSKEFEKKKKQIGIVQIAVNEGIEI